MSHRQHTVDHGPVSRRLNNGKQFEWKPSGPLTVIVVDVPVDRSASEDKDDRRLDGKRENLPIGFVARLFVGLSVGQTPTWKLDDVIRAVREWRSDNNESVDSSFILQKGIYGDVTEDSVQIVLFDVSGTPEVEFGKQVDILARFLRKRFDQDAVYVEVQNGGRVLQFYSIERRKDT